MLRKWLYGALACPFRMQEVNSLVLVPVRPYLNSIFWGIWRSVFLISVPDLYQSVICRGQKARYYLTFSRIATYIPDFHNPRFIIVLYVPYSAVSKSFRALNNLSLFAFVLYLYRNLYQNLHAKRAGTVAVSLAVVLALMISISLFSFRGRS